MIRLTKLAIEGFRSFKEDQVFTFPPDKAGFYLLKGKNLVEPELGANGAGKSSLLEAICYVLYGKTSRGLRAKEIANREEENLTTICLEFEKDGVLHGLTRTWNPNSLILDIDGVAKPVDQNAVDDIFGVNYESFLRTVIFSQFATYFFDMSPAAKLLVFSDLLNLEVWDKSAGTAKSNIKDLEVACNKELSYLSKIDGELLALLDEKTRTLERYKVFSSNKDDRKLELDHLLKEQTSILSKSKEELSKLETSRKEIEHRIQKLRTRIISFGKSKRKEEQVQKEVEKAITVLQTKAESVRKQYQQVNEIKSNCPYCDQHVDSAHKTKIDKFTNSQFKEIRSDLDKSVVQLEAVKSKINDLVRRQKEIDTDIGSLETALTETTVRINRSITKTTLAKEQLARTEKDIVELLSKENPYESSLKLINTKIEETEGKTTFHKTKLTKLKKDIVDIEFWQNKFRDVKFWLIERALNELELYTNNALSELGLSGYKVRFDVERNRADGSSIRSFQTSVTKRGEKDPVPWEAWSGGEIQRIRLAGTIGLSDLISSRTGFLCNVEFWDEPTAHLSEEGITDLLTVLSARARIRNKQVWLVDHRTLDAGEFDNVITIIKDKFGSKILQPRHTTKVVKVKDFKELNTQTKSK